MMLALYLKRDLIETGGNLSRAAYRTGVSRRTAYDLITYFGIWSVVNKSRRKRFENLEVNGNDLLQRTKLSMRG